MAPSTDQMSRRPGSADVGPDGADSSAYAGYRAHRRATLGRSGLIWLVILAALVYSIWGTGFGVLSLIGGMYESVSFLVDDTLPPRFVAAPGLLQPTLETAYMSVVAVTISVVIAMPIGVLAAKNTSPHIVVSYLAKAVAGFSRAVPSLILAIFLVAVLGVGPLPGAIALAIGGVGVLGKAYGDAIEDIDPGQIEGLRSAGANWFHVVAQGVWPQMKPAFVTWTLYRLEHNVRAGAVVGLVGAGGIGYSLMSAIDLFRFRTATMIIVMIFALVLVIEFITTSIRKRVI